MVISLSPCPVFGNRQQHVDVALRVEGKGGGGVAAFSGPAGRTQAGVAVLTIISQYGNTTCLMLTLVLLAADQADVTVMPTPWLLARFWLGTLTPIGVGSVFARGTILAGIAVALVDVHLTVHTCEAIWTQTLIRVDQILAASSMLTWSRLTFIHID